MGFRAEERPGTKTNQLLQNRETSVCVVYIVPTRPKLKLFEEAEVQVEQNAVAFGNDKAQSMSNQKAAVDLLSPVSS